MPRKLIGAVVLVAASLVVGCKDDGPTSKQFDPKAGYTNQQGYNKENAGKATTTTTNP